MYVTAFNPASSPVVVSEEGHSLGGGEWVTVDTTDSVTKAALAAGSLIHVVEDEVERSDRAGDAAAEVLVETARRQERADVLEGRDKPALMKIAKAGGLVTGDEDVLRADLERRIVASDVALKVAAPKKQTQSSEEK